MFLHFKTKLYALFNKKKSAYGFCMTVQYKIKD